MLYKYRVWDPKRRVVVKSRDLIFDSLPPPTLNDSRPQPTDEDEPTRQPALGHTTGSDPPASTLPYTSSLEATHDNGPTTTPHLCITVRLPGRLMKRPAVERRDESDEHCSEDKATRRFVRPRLSCAVDAFRPHAQWRIILDEAAHPPIAFSASLPAVQLRNPRH